MDEYVARIEEKRNVYSNLVGETRGKYHVGDLLPVKVNNWNIITLNIKFGLIEAVCSDMN
jgi:hypothetical protein